MSKGWVILLHSIIEILLIEQVCPTIIAELLDVILITQPCDPHFPTDGSEESREPINESFEAF